MRRLARIPNLADLAALARLFEFRAVSRWVGLGLAVGLVSGLGAGVFLVGMDWVRHVVFVLGANWAPLEPRGEHSWFSSDVHGAPRRWIFVIGPAAGALLSGVIVSRFAPEAEGHGTDSLIEAFHARGGYIRPRVPFVKTLASILLIGTGGSAGREGPIAQIGAGFGSFLSSAMRFTPRERRLLILAGAAGGIGAIFRTPLGGALFAIEVLYRDDFEVDALVPAVLSAVVAYSVFTLVFGQGAMFATEAHYHFDPRQLPMYLVMAIGAALVGMLYVRVFYGMRDALFSRLKIPRALKPMLGGLALGLLALELPQALGASYGLLQEAILPTGKFPTGWLGAGVLLGFALAKILSTSLSVSSGGSGGVFGPSVVIGGMVGGAFGCVFHRLFPVICPQPGAFVIVGMACFFGGIAKVPVSSLVMASEMTGSYDLLVPIMMAEVVVYGMSRSFSLYERQVPTRRHSPAHGGEYVLDVLQDVRVEDAFRRTSSITTIPASMTLDELLRRASKSPHVVFPVVTEHGETTGLVTLDSVREYLFDEDMGRLAIAADCASPFVSIDTHDSLAVALQRLASSELRELPVLDATESGRIVGFLSHEGVLGAYTRELARRRDPASPPGSRGRRMEARA